MKEIKILERKLRTALDNKESMLDNLTLTLIDIKTIKDELFKYKCVVCRKKYTLVEYNFIACSSECFENV